MAGPEKKYYIEPAKKYSTAPDVVRRREERDQRRQTCLQLRMAGASYADIVRANIGYKSIAHVTIDMKNILQNFQYETPENLVMLDLARLDDIQRRVTFAFHAGKTEQAGMLLRIMQFRREILGVTPEQAREARESANSLVNNGIMVVQGSAEEYLKSMMQAAGATPEQQRQELDRVAASNRQQLRIVPDEVIQDAEIVEEVPGTAPRKVLRKPRKKLRKPSNKSPQIDDGVDSKELESRILESEQNDDEVDKLPLLQLSDPLLSIDFPDGDQPKKKRLRVRVKADDPNINTSGAVSYRKAPERASEEVSQRKLLSRGAKRPETSETHADQGKHSGRPSHRPVGGLYQPPELFDEIEVETLSQNIE